MRDNRYTALIDANILVGALTRNLVLSFAEAGLFRPIWSERILAETEQALRALLERKDGSGERASRQCHEIRRAFPEAVVDGYEDIIPALDLPDAEDRHVLAAALVGGASVIVTDNLKDFPERAISKYQIEASTCDAFLADAIDLNAPVAIAAVRKMRARFRKPELTGEALIVRMESIGLTETADLLIKSAKII